MDHAAQIRQFAPDADPAVIDAVLKRYQLVLSKPDSATVAFSDPEELARVKENFLKKKLGLDRPEDQLDAAIEAVGERMKGTQMKSRAAVYYLLAQHFGALDQIAG